MTPVNEGRLKLLALFVVFLAPLVAAVLIYFVPSLRPEGRVNHGTLVEPLRAVPALALLDAAGDTAPTALRGKWSLVYIGGADCGDSCSARLVLERQVRLALGKDRDRVQRILVAPSRDALARLQQELGAEHPDLVWLVDAGARGARAADFFSVVPADSDALYLVDPLGNWLMVYAGDVTHKGLHKDLKKLLRMSTIG